MPSKSRSYCEVSGVPSCPSPRARGRAPVHPQTTAETSLGRVCQRCCYNDQEYSGIKTTELPEHQKINLRAIVTDLQTKPMEVQLERDVLQDTRQKESQSQENEKIQLKNAIQELEAANHLQEEMLREADSQTERLKKMVQSQEEVLLELHRILRDYKDRTGKKLCAHENIAALHMHNLSTAFAAILRDVDSEVSCLKEKVVLVEEELESLKKDSQTQRQLLLQQHQNREQSRNQNTVRVHQVSHLQSTVSQLHSESQEAKRMSEDKVKDLEESHPAHSETAKPQTEQDPRGQESGSLQDQIHQLMTELHKKEIELHLEKEQNKRIWDRNTDDSIIIDHLRRELDNKTMQLQHMESTVKAMRAECHRQMEHQMAAIKEKNESIGRISSLTVQLESSKETLCKVKEDLTAKQMDLETAEQTVSDLTACLQEKESALELAEKEIKELHSQLGSRMQELQHLKNEENRLRDVQSECETLKLQVTEKERIIDIFQKQIDIITQIVGQHSRTAGAMEVEKSQLIKELNDWKLEARELKIAMDEKESRIHEMETRVRELELENVKLINTCTERLHALNDMKLEKDQLMNELQGSQSELAGLAEEFEDLKRDYQNKIKEMENTVNRLKMQLKSAEAELEQTRTALKAIEGSDGLAMKVAVGMQKQITAKRGQIDVLQSKIKFLEEATTNAAKEKHYLREENSKLSQELSYITAENTKIAGELEILRAQDRRLKEKLSKMETALDKASVQFAECQCIIQCQEQAAMRFRLQHTLDVKELQGPGYSSTSAWGRRRHTTPLSQLRSAVLGSSRAPRMPSKPGVLKEEPLQDLKRILQELTSSDNDIPTVDLGKSDSSGGRKSPLATVRNTVDPSCLRTADIQSQDVTLPFASPAGTSIFSAAPCHTSCSEMVSREERLRDKSPVHALLTSPRADAAAGPSASAEHRRRGRKCGSPGGAAVPQTTSQPMETSMNTPRRLQNKVESLQNLVESLQTKNQALSSTIRTQEMKTDRVKEKKKKLSK
ncbi:coiled-coil domain-containing protein 158 isoform X1 [Patagioenas fasciata]|uniref:coiled-coil domain-containing protein 158 isoform X1 n=1 Tax=Patagioenas fasciata TaxID=372321 RepID=UPI003A98FA7F